VQLAGKLVFDTLRNLNYSKRSEESTPFPSDNLHRANQYDCKTVADRVLRASMRVFDRAFGI